MTKTIIFTILAGLLFFSGCSSDFYILENNNIDDLNSTNYTTYSSDKINNLISNINVTGGNGSTYYAGTGLILNSSNFFSINGSYIQSLVNSSNFSINYSQVQARVNGTCASGSSIRVIYQNGSVECEDDTTGGGGGGSTYNYYNSTVVYNNTIPINGSDATYTNNTLTNYVNYYLDGGIVNTTIYYNSTHMTYAVQNNSGVVRIMNFTYDSNGNIIGVRYN